MATENRTFSPLVVWLARLLAVLFGIALAWLLLEIGLRLAFDALPPDTQGVLQHVRRVPWDEEHMVPPFPYIGSYEHQARLAPGHQDYPVRWGDASFSFDTISLWELPVGFRTHEPQWPVDLVAVGDSFTFCWTALEDCWVEKLGQEFGWSVMNLGIPGTGTLSHQSLLEPYAKPLEPQVVLWQWYGNDYKDDYDFDRIQDRVQPLPGPPEIAPPPDHGRFAEYSAVYRLLRDWWYRRDRPAVENGFVTQINGREMFFTDRLGEYDFAYENVQYGYDRALEALSQSRAYIQQEMNADMVIVLIPTKEELYADHLTDRLDASHIAKLREGRERLLATCEERNWRCLDLSPAFQEALSAETPLYHAFDFHLDASGNALLAQVLGDYLIAEGLLPAQP